jgi:RecA/RadA recombinase
MNNTQKLLEVLGKNAKRAKSTASYGTIADTARNYRWIDFCDPKNGNCPALALEWLWGARGMLTGRMLKIDAPEGSGKSSYIMLQYAMGQKMNNAFCIHEETEHAIAPPDYIASFGADPDGIIFPQLDVRSLENIFADIDWTCLQIRSDVDPDKKSPIIVGLDSISAAGSSDAAEDETFELNKGGISEVARLVSKYFRDRFDSLAKKDVLLVIIAQQRHKIQTGGFTRPGEPKMTTIAAQTLDYHASYRLTMFASAIKDTGKQIGDLVTFTVKKNKLSPKARQISIPLIWGHGFDLQSPFVEMVAKNPIILPSGDTFAIEQSSYVKCPMLGFSARSSAEAKNELMQMVYANAPLLSQIREALQIRGFGFAFEKWEPEAPSEIPEDT